MASLLRIDGVDIRRPSDLQYGFYNLTKSGRVASGKMKMDIIAQKRKFQFKYDIIRASDMEIIEGLIFNPNRPFFVLTYQQNQTTKEATVYSGDINYTRFRTDGIWYYKGVSFDLIEQ